MKTVAGKFLTVYVILTLVFAGAAMNSFASGQYDKTHAIFERSAEDLGHATLAYQYENSARKMQASIKAQQILLRRKLGYGNFKKNGWRYKSRAAFRIRGFKKAAREYLEKAAYHHRMAAKKVKSKSVAEQNQIKRSESSM